MISGASIHSFAAAIKFLIERKRREVVIINRSIAMGPQCIGRVVRPLIATNGSHVPKCIPTCRLHNDRIQLPPRILADQVAA